MAGFLDKMTDIAKSAAQATGELAKTATDKGMDMVEITKLNSQIRSEEQAKGELLKELGKLYRDKILNDEVQDPLGEEFCRQLSEKDKNISSMEMEIQRIRE